MKRILTRTHHLHTPTEKIIRSGLENGCGLVCSRADISQLRRVKFIPLWRSAVSSSSTRAFFCAILTQNPKHSAVVHLTHLHSSRRGESPAASATEMQALPSCCCSCLIMQMSQLEMRSRLPTSSIYKLCKKRVRAREFREYPSSAPALSISLASEHQRLFDCLTTL